MGANSKIEWCEHTFNPWWGCAKVSPGCKNCYAEREAERWHPGHWGIHGSRKMMSEKYWNDPIRWNAKAASADRLARVFCASMADVFEDRDDLLYPRERLFQLIEKTPNLIWLLLTKRPENVRRLSRRWLRWSDRYDFPENVCLMTSAEDQATADLRIPYLLDLRVRYRALSLEPLIGDIDIEPYLRCSNCGYSQKDVEWYGDHRLCSGLGPGIHQVIVGGESGPNARPMHPDWVRSIRDVCIQTGTPFLFKQWGEYSYELRECGPDGEPWADKNEYFRTRVGKKKAGRLLDVREWNEHPFEMEPA